MRVTQELSEFSSLCLSLSYYSEMVGTATKEKMKI